jgi:stress-induced morphogen
MPENLGLQQRVRKKIEAALPGAKVVLRDFTGEGNHLEANVVWAGFEGMTPVQQHRRVYEALAGMVGGEAPVHALALKTWARAPAGLESPSPAEPQG